MNSYPDNFNQFTTFDYNLYDNQYALNENNIPRENYAKLMPSYNTTIVNSTHNFKHDDCERRYKFIRKEEEDIYNYRPLKDINFYQVAAYRNPRTDKHEVRLFIIDKNNELAKYMKIGFGEKEFKEFLRNTPNNRYRIYSVFTLDEVDFPNAGDIMLARSCLIN